MTDDDKRAYLRARGWGTWYHENYWVHVKTVADPTVQDHTSYGLSLDKAYDFEREGKPPFPPAGLAIQQGFQILRALDKAADRLGKG